MDIHTVLANLPAGVICTEPSGRICFANPAFADLLGCGVDEVLGRNVGDFYVHKEAREAFIRQVEKNRTHRTWLCWKGRLDETLWIRTHAACLESPGAEKRYLGIVERGIPPMSEALPRDTVWLASDILQGKLDRYLDSLPFSVAYKNDQGIVVYGNKHYCQNEARCDRSELKERRLTDEMLYPAGLAARYLQDDAVVLETGAVLDYTEPHPRQGDDSALTEVHVVKMPVRDSAGAVCGVLFFFWEESDALPDVRQLMRVAEGFDVVQHTFPIVYEHDLDGVFTYINRAGERLTGYGSEDFVGRSIVDIVSPEDLRLAKRMLETKLGSSAPPITKYKLEIRSGDGGSPIHLEVVSCKIGLPGKELVRGYARDLRRDILAMDDSRHVIRNFLEGFQRAVDRELPPDASTESRTFALGLSRRIKAMKLIADEAVEFSAGGWIEFGMRLPGFLDQLSEIYLLGDDAVAVRCSCQEGVVLAADQVEVCFKVLYELVLNAFKHAFPGDQEGLILVDFHVADDGRACLTVDDDGIGLPDVIVRRNGLALVEELVRSDLNGVLEVDRKLQAGASGTTFRVQFTLKSREKF